MSADRDAGKRHAGYAAADYIEDGMTIGIGTGSTANFFIDALAEKIAGGWRLSGVPTSEDSHRRAVEAGVDIITPDETTQIDVAVDGADEADPQMNLIKGGGGALLREKIVAQSAGRFVMIADKSKRVPSLGKFALPVEVEPFGWALTISALRRALADAGFANAPIQLRAGADAPFRSDGGHLIFDCALDRIDDPAALDNRLKTIPGVIETGLFCGMVDIAIFGDDEGVKIETPKG